jgi:hypothetical protein
MIQTFIFHSFSPSKNNSNTDRMKKIKKGKREKTLILHHQIFSREATHSIALTFSTFFCSLLKLTTSVAYC